MRKLLSMVAATLMLFAFVGCHPMSGGSGGSGGTGGFGTNPGGTSGKLYVANSTSNSILRFNNASTITGNVTPDANITGANTLLSSPQYLYIDTAGDRLYVANLGGNSILIFNPASTVTGNAPPVANISGLNTLLNKPAAVAVDTTKNLLYVSNQGGNQILAFATANTISGAPNNLAPTRIITTTPAMNGPGAIVSDAANDRLYVADTLNNAIIVIDNASTQGVAPGAPVNTISPSRTISGTSTQIIQPSGMELSSNNVLFVASTGTTGGPGIVIFSSASTTNGNVAPSSVITGSSTLIAGPQQIKLHSGSGDLFVVNSSTPSITAYTNGATATGNVAPARTICNLSTGTPATCQAGSGNTSLNTPTGLTIDTTR